MGIARPYIDELTQEAETTRRVLERVPDDKLSWRPHATSWSLGQLALHTAQVPGAFAHLLQKLTFDGPVPSQAEAASRDEILAAFDDSISRAKASLSGSSDQDMQAVWSFQPGGQTKLAAPRAGIVRSLMFNHWYHHRGQLTVYLRQLGIPVPSVYGPSADENPFG
jgi:uncharacterized damage-inducible protein DinB